MSRHLIALGASAVGFMLAACGGNTPAPVTPDEGALAGEMVDAEGKPAPRWVSAPNTYRKDSEDMRVVCGAGSVGSTSNFNLAQSASAGRARTALARQLETKVRAMLKDYQATTTGGGQYGQAANDEQHIVDAAKQVTDMSLSGTEVAETWISSKSTVHSLVCLNVQRFKDIVNEMGQLEEAVRHAVVTRADAAWSELDDEVGLR